jgi:hypothetical protein
LITEYFRIDIEYSNLIKSNDIAILKNGIIKLDQKIHKNLPSKDLQASYTEMEIIYARALCINYLRNSLLFKSKGRQLEEAKEIFSKYRFIQAIDAAIAIDTFVHYLNYYCPKRNINEITKEQEVDLFIKLNKATELDGAVTKRFADRFAASLKPELQSAIIESVKPIVAEEGIKIRKALSKGIAEIKVKQEEIRELFQEIIAIVKRNPKRIQTLLNKQSDELKQILLEIAKQLENRDPSKAKKAKKWYNYLIQGIGLAASLTALFVFLTEIESMPALANSDIPIRIVELFRQLTSKVS